MTAVFLYCKEIHVFRRCLLHSLAAWYTYCSGSQDNLSYLISPVFIARYKQGSE